MVVWTSCKGGGKRYLYEYIIMLKNKSLSTFEALVGFIVRFMNQAASHLKQGGALDTLHEVDHREGFYRQTLGEARKLLAKERIVSGKVTFSSGKTGVLSGRLP